MSVMQNYRVFSVIPKIWRVMGSPKSNTRLPLLHHNCFHHQSLRTLSISSPKTMLETPDERSKFAKMIFPSRVPKSVIKSTGSKLYSQCGNQPNISEFIQELDLPDTFFTWFMVTELHIWMLGVRLNAEESNEGQMVWNQIIEVFWKDCDDR